MSNVDVMISYDGADEGAAKRIAGKLSAEGLRVWYDTGKSGADKGLAVVQCKVFMQILSEASAASKSCQDELSLAYISDTPIFPVGLKNFSAIAPHLDSGRKLILAKINWTFFTKEEDYEKRFPALLESLRSEMERIGQDASPEGDEEDVQFSAMNRTKSIRSDDVPEDMKEYLKEYAASSAMEGGDNRGFWARHFGDESQVAWLSFRDKFLDDYKTRIHGIFGEDKEKWLCGLIFKDIFELAKDVKRINYINFCPSGTNNPHYFFNRVKDYATAMFAMKEVFDMDSTVRLIAVQNLGKFRTPAVISTLLDLLNDADPNMRAVSALALGRSGKKTKKVVDRLLKALEDEDRLVRESVCLSLGHLKVERAVQPILDMWRNDAISTVREAAKIALTKIGGKEAESAIKVTQVLTEEMSNLRKKRSK